MAVEDLVVVGASAGGIEALGALVSTLPKDFPAPIVIAQHLDPSRPSSLRAILERRSAVPVVTIEGRMKLEPSTIYVTPSNRHVAIEDGHVMLESDQAGRPRPSVDLLLSTAAKAYGEHLYAMILTGSGSDGAAGAIDVKAAGGTVIIQNPATAQHPSMPLALPPTIVDHVVELRDLGLALDQIVRGQHWPNPDEHVATEQLAKILELMGERTNVDFRSYKPATIRRRIARRMTAVHAKTLEEYAAYLETNPDEVGLLLKAFLIQVTEFMRDPDAYEYLRTHVLPERIEHARERDRVLRLWSAGCATGEEPYSLAMIVSELLRDELPRWRVKIFATDLDPAAIEFARRGIYPANLLRAVPDEVVARYFTPTPHGLQVTKALRSMVIFGQQDLSRGTPFPRIDLILCRNLLIYFKHHLQEEILDLFSFSLHQDRGHLMLGKAEAARPSKSTYELIERRWKVYRCLSSPLLAKFSEKGPPSIHAPRRVQTTELVRASSVEGERSARRGDDILVANLSVGAALIDRAYRVLSLNNSARRLLRIRETVGVEQDFLHAARGLPYLQVRAAIDAAFRDGTAVTLEEVELDRLVVNETRVVTMHLAPVPIDGAEQLVITIVDATMQSETRRRLEAAQLQQTALIGELSNANTRLGELNVDLQDANEELQAANEEMVVTQEELQATNEELEATNEEFQATNEELETNNEELQATNEELATTNDELHLRTVELKETSRTLDEQMRVAEELGRLDRLKDEFLSLMSHELRTPMTTLRGYAELLRQASSAGDGAAVTDSASKFDKQLDHLGRMIDDLFDVARMHAGKFSLEIARVELRQLVMQAAESARVILPQHALRLELDEGTYELQADPDRLTQVVLNLLQNAARYAQPGSPIELRLRRVAGSDGRADAYLSVHDHGAGIHPDAVPSLFTRFYQAPRKDRPSRGGLGLGLFISKQIVEQHGGSIGVESVFGAGSTFFVSLPLTRADHPLAEPSTNGAAHGARGTQEVEDVKESS